MSNLDKVESSLDQLQDRGRIVDRMVNEALLGKGRDDHRWHAHARTPLIDDRWRHVIPIAAVLVEGDDDDRLRPDRTLFNQSQHLIEMLIAV